MRPTASRGAARPRMARNARARWARLAEWLQRRAAAKARLDQHEERHNPKGPRARKVHWPSFHCSVAPRLRWAIPL
eukprot:3452267-Alexandrium_andersonii.AAC.1